MRRALAIPLALFAFFALTGIALAGGDGPAAGEEYILDIPGADGDQPGGAADTSDSPDSGSAVPAGTENDLLEEGADGGRAAELARETDPGPGGHSNGGSSDTEQAVSDDGSGLAEVVADVASGSDSGMGPFLPVVLVLALAAALALAVWRRRGSGAADS
jgi:MYXO-CTERM domain-containing protein